ncbi:hypothetical protein DL95DRAFT_401276 [Leptodontidium sp. 2 PMI_412]|nr:hypothetical protein DL95DRAFT_401276 [Leptodontidium sp. 2 PMI_412]
MIVISRVAFSSPSVSSPISFPTWPTISSSPPLPASSLSSLVVVVPLPESVPFPLFAFSSLFLSLSSFVPIQEGDHHNNTDTITKIAMTGRPKRRKRRREGCIAERAVGGAVVVGVVVGVVDVVGVTVGEVVEVGGSVGVGGILDYCVGVCVFVYRLE